MKHILFCGLLCWLFMGCHYTTVHLEDPQGATLVYEGDAYVFPTRVAFQRPGDLGDTYIYPITLTFPVPNGGSMTVSGELEVYGYIEHQTDIINPHQFSFSPGEAMQLAEGNRVVHEAKSKSGYTIFKLDLRP